MSWHVAVVTGERLAAAREVSLMLGRANIGTCDTNIRTSSSETQEGGPEAASQVAMGVRSNTGDAGIWEEDGYLIAGFARLHNRSELYGRLRDSGRTPDILATELALILCGYRAWGKEVAPSLLGSFAFFIWDPLHHGLFAARDHFGICSIFMRKHEMGLSMSTDVGMLLPEINPDSLDSNYFRCFMARDGRVDADMTPYRDVNRLPKAHWLWAKGDSLKTDRYWCLSDVQTDPKGVPEEALYEEFYATLLDAVRCRLSPVETNVIALSGGVDSSAIFTIAKQLERRGEVGPVRAVTASFDSTPESDERQFVEALTQFLGTRSRFVPTDDGGLGSGSIVDVPWTFEPRVALMSYGFSGGLYQAATEMDGARFVTGKFGDHLLNGSPMVASDLLRLGAVGPALRSAWVEAQISQNSVSTTLWKSVLKPLLAQHAPADHWMNLAPEEQSVMLRLPTENQRDLFFQSTGLAGQYGMDDLMDSQFGTTTEHPFRDRRLWELLFRSPGGMRWHAGITKYVLRRVMKGTMPDLIVERLSKAHQLSIYMRAIRRHWATIWDEAQHARVSKWGLVSSAQFLTLLQELRQGSVVRDDLWLLLTLELWLGRVFKRQELLSLAAPVRR